MACTENQRLKQISSIRSSKEYQEIRLVRKSRCLEERVDAYKKTFRFYTEGISIFEDS